MADLYTRFVSNIFFPVHERLKHHHSVPLRRELEQSQWWERSRILDVQAERLRQLMQVAYQGSPYYREVFDTAGSAPGDIETVADLARLPFLTKAVIRAEQQRLATVPLEQLQKFNTGGSSGEPLVFYMGKDRVSHDVAAKWRATRWWNVDIGDPEIVVWGSPVELGAQDRLRQFRDRLLRSRLVPAFEMSEANLDRFVAEIRAFRPRMLFGYPSSLSLIARHARQRGIAMDGLGIAVAFVTSEKLYPEQAAAISEVFNCPVANGYGARDAGFLAHQCPAGGMHVCAEHVVIEIIGPDGQVLPEGEAGEIVITHLATGEYPFVRYRTGDVGILDGGTCSCGRGLPMLKEIQGRTTDFVVAQDGTVMHGLALIYVVRELAGISSFKIIQESLQRTRLLLVTDDRFDPSLLPTIRAGFRERLGQDVDIDIDIVDEIPPERSGKFRYVVSQVDPDRRPGPG